MGKNHSDLRIAIIGLGYVGLPLALGFSEASAGKGNILSVIGFDLNHQKVSMLRDGMDPIHEGLGDRIKKSTATFTSNEEHLTGCNVFILCVPTPVDEYKKPDLNSLEKGCRLVGSVLKKGGLVIIESTVYPGVTEEICVPILEQVSKLKSLVDFNIGYSPERMNPGDIGRGLKDLVKVVAGDSPESLERVAQLYEMVVEAGVYRAESIRVAEAAKVIENTQRDLNIALMNELAIIFDRMGISTRQVIAAARTKWNFLPFVPGLVGGHCVGVDPYYLTSKIESLGYHPNIILAGRRINDGMGEWIGQKVVKLLIERGIHPNGAKVGILGLTFKENVSDIRNTRVYDVYSELKAFGVDVKVADPHVQPSQAKEEYGVELADFKSLNKLDAVVIAVAHNEFQTLGSEGVSKMVHAGGVIVDLKHLLDPKEVNPSIAYWSL